MIKTPNEFKEQVRTDMRGGTGDVVFRHLWTPGEDSFAKLRTFATLTLAPGNSIGKHTHENEEEIFWVVSGTAETDDNGIVKTMRKGDTSICRSGESHSLKNIGTEPLTVLAAIVKTV